MPRPGQRPIGRIATLLVSGSLLWNCEEAQRPAEVDAEEPSKSALARSDRSAQTERPDRAGRPAAIPSADTRHAVLEALSHSSRDPTIGHCGPYEVLATAPPRYLVVCETLAARLDTVYQERLGVEITSEPAGLIALFGESAAFRQYASEVARLRPGYAGFSLAGRGVIALSTEDVALDRFAQTLAHELAHLVHRRIFGPRLAPWLSEGLADAIGDTASAAGFSSLEGLTGAEHLAGRLLEGIELGRADPISLLLVKSRREFDRGLVSYDYEGSALLTRFLLLDSALAPRFRRALDRLATVDGCDVVCLFEQLGIDGPELEGRFLAWLSAESES